MTPTALRTGSPLPRLGAATERNGAVTPTETAGMRRIRPRSGRVRTLLVLAAAAGVPGASAACAPPLHVASLDAIERTRSSEMARESARSAPDAYARAERQRDLARHAHAAGDDVGANLYAEHALAAYEHASIVARLSRALAERSDAEKELQEATAQLASIDADRAKLEKHADDLDERARIARERAAPASSARATAEREAARRTAARTLVAEARLLCGAARLVKADVDDLAPATNEVAAVEDRLARAISPHAPNAAASSPAPPAPMTSPSSPVDEASGVRARCLQVLQLARRGDGVDQSDRLLAELSASGGWGPARDERGVVVALSGAFQGGDLANDVAAKLLELGRVAAAHASFAIQIVVHDATPPAHGDFGDLDVRRSEAAVRVLVAGGANPKRIDAELAGVHIPVADPGDARQRERNDRLEVVFVAP